MKNIINCVIDTKTSKEREKIIKYLNSIGITDCLLSDFKGFELYAINNNSSGWVGVHVARCMVEKYGYKHFLSTKEFFEYISK